MHLCNHRSEMFFLPKIVTTFWKKELLPASVSRASPYSLHGARTRFGTFFFFHGELSACSDFFRHDRHPFENPVVCPPRTSPAQWYTKLNSARQIVCCHLCSALLNKIESATYLKWRYLSAYSSAWSVGGLCVVTVLSTSDNGCSEVRNTASRHRLRTPPGFNSFYKIVSTFLLCIPRDTRKDIDHITTFHAPWLKDQRVPPNVLGWHEWTLTFHSWSVHVQGHINFLNDRIWLPSRAIVLFLSWAIVISSSVQSLACLVDSKETSLLSTVHAGPSSRRHF